MSWVFGLVLKWHDNSELSSLGDASAIPWANKISELVREFLSRILRKASWYKEKDQKTHRAEDWRMFSAEDNWVLFKKRRLWFSTHACHGRRWGQRGMKWRYARNSHLEASLFSTERERHRLSEKAWTVWGPALRLKLKIPLQLLGKMKNIVVWLSTSSRVSRLQVWKQMHSWLTLPMSTSWWQENLSARSRRRYSRISCDPEKKKRLCISKFRSNEFYFTESWRIGIERLVGHT